MKGIFELSFLRGRFSRPEYRTLYDPIEVVENAHGRHL